jgi:hypothetical protein
MQEDFLKEFGKCAGGDEHGQNSFILLAPPHGALPIWPPHLWGASNGMGSRRSVKVPRHTDLRLE